MKQPSLTSSSPMALATAAVVGVAVILSSTFTVEATVASTCKAAADSDVRVNLQLCVSQLSNQRGAADADTWGLAKVASLAGVNSASLAADDVKTLQVGNPSLPMRPALAKCATAFSEASVAFAAATDEINGRNYGAGRKKLDEALALAQGCNSAFGLHGVTLPQPLARHTVDSIQIAIIASAITSLVK